MRNLLGIALAGLLALGVAGSVGAATAARARVGMCVRVVDVDRGEGSGARQATNRGKSGFPPGVHNSGPQDPAREVGA